MSRTGRGDLGKSRNNGTSFSIGMLLSRNSTFLMTQKHEHDGSVPSFVEKEKRRTLLLTKQIAQRGEGGRRREEGYHD